MYPSKPTADAAASNKELDASRSAAPSLASGEKGGPPSDFAHQSANPSAPLLPSGPYNPAGQNLEPPPYSSVVAQDSENWNNRSGSFSRSNNAQPYPPGPGPAPGPTNQAPYPTGGFPSYGPPAQAPYPTGATSGPGFAGSSPYPPGPGSGITTQPPYSTGPPIQPPYPVAPMPMPESVNSGRQIGFTAPVTTEPKSASVGYPPGGYVSVPAGMPAAPYPVNGNQGMNYPSGENTQFIPSQYAPNQYGQQQPNTVYVVQKTPERNTSSDDDCCFLACCLASCYCLCECIKICVNSD